MDKSDSEDYHHDNHYQEDTHHYNYDDKYHQNYDYPGEYQQNYEGHYDDHHEAETSHPVGENANSEDPLQNVDLTAHTGTVYHIQA